MKRNGFTLVELLIVVVLGGLVLAAIFQVLVSNQQIYTRQSQAVMGQQTVRGGIEYLSQEIREISPAGGDILGIDEDRFEMRVMRKVGVACEAVDDNGAVRVTVALPGQRFVPDESVVLFYNSGSGDPEDDAFAEGVVSGESAAGTPDQCGGEATRRVTVGSLNPSVNASQVGAGALLRSVETVTYTPVVLDGETYLGRRIGGGTTEPLVGPIAATDGLVFEYFDVNGDPTTTPNDVRSVRVTLRTISQARDQRGQPIEESLSVIVNPRN